MRRFLTLVCLLGLALPAGISISGCIRNPAGNYCNGLGYGLKDTDVANLTMQPQVGGISLAFGQTQQVQSPTATTCKGQSASVAANSFIYGTTNNQLVDISPSGNLCAGTWNRNTGGGIADYTVCNYPSPQPSTKGLPYAVSYITATADSISSNPVAVYVHAPITSINLVSTPIAGASAKGCYSQTQQAQLDAQAYYSSGNAQALLCAPNSATLPQCSASIGTLNFVVANSTVASVNATTNVITALNPGTTAITANIAQTSTAAGYFSTCPPASISVSLANGSTTGVVTQGVTQNLTTKVIDTNGNAITGLSLQYQSTNPIDITASNAGAITTTYPGTASVYATCQPNACNPAPINEIGLNGTGLSIASNPVSIIVPGTTSDFVWFAAPGQSQYFSSIELLTGTPGSTVRLPFVPNSMIMDQTGANLYFGSQRELMIYSTTNNSLTKQDTTVPGVILAVSPDGSKALINDPIRGLFYLYNEAAGSALTFGGLGSAAAFTPDSSTLYVVDSAAQNSLPQNIAAGITGHTNTLYVYNTNTGWSSYDLSASGGSQSVAVTLPGVGAYLAGNPTVARTWCPTGTVGNNSTLQLYPQGDTVNLLTSILGATTDGKHILGASLNGASINLNDIGVTIPTTQCPQNTASTPQTLGQPNPLSTNPAINGTVNLTGVTNAAAVNQIVTGSAPATASVTTAAQLDFVTYSPLAASTTVAQLPYYLPQASGPGIVGYVPFADAASATPPTAPLAGAFSPDNSIFFVSTQGDNQIHFISIPTNIGSVAPTDTQQFSPNLPACTPVSVGGTDAGCFYPIAPAPNAVVPATAISVKPRTVT